MGAKRSPNRTQNFVTIAFLLAICIVWGADTVLGGSRSRSALELSESFSKGVSKGSSRLPSGRVDIGDNCAAVLFTKTYALTSDAAKHMDRIRELTRPTAASQLAALFAFDSEYSFIGMTPEEREEAMVACDKLNHWSHLGGKLEMCTLLLAQISHSFTTESGAMVAYVYVDKAGNKRKLYTFYSKTKKAKLCLDSARSGGYLTFGRHEEPVVTQAEYKRAQETKQSIEFYLLSHSRPKALPPVILQLIRRKHATTADARRALNFDARQVFFSPNDAKYPIHRLDVAPFLSDRLLQTFVDDHAKFSLAEILSRFAIQAIYLDDPAPAKHPKLLRVLRDTADSTGATLFASTPIDKFKRLPLSSLLTTALERDESLPSNRAADYPLVAYPQILVITSSKKVFLDKQPYLHLQLTDANKFKTAPSKEQTLKEGGETLLKPVLQQLPVSVKHDIENTNAEQHPSRQLEPLKPLPQGVKLTALSPFLQSLKDAGFTDVVTDVQPGWKLSAAIPKSMKLTVAKRPKTMGKNVVYITNSPSRYREIQNKVGLTLLNGCLYPIHPPRFPQCLVNSDKIPFRMQKIVGTSLEKLVNEVPSTPKEMAHELQLGGLEAITFIGDKKKTVFWNKVAEELKKKGIPEVAYERGEAGTSGEKRLIVVDPNYMGPIPTYFGVTVDRRGLPRVYFSEAVQLSQGLRFKEILIGVHKSRAQELKDTFKLEFL